jgi:hypothetical protein
MKATERISKALNIPVEKVDVTVTRLQGTFESNGKKRSFLRVANMLAATVTKRSTPQYNQNDIAFVNKWIADKRFKLPYLNPRP